MRSLLFITSLLTLIASCTIAGAAQRAQSSIPVPTQERSTQGVEEDHIYTAREVDVKAKLTNKKENLPKAGKDCPREGQVKLTIVLHKSGKVTGVTITKGMACSYDEASVEVARKIKFTPAVKDGQQVSQYQMFEYRYATY
jgi:TonB family protein